MMIIIPFLSTKNFYKSKSYTKNNKDNFRFLTFYPKNNFDIGGGGVTPTPPTLVNGGLKGHNLKNYEPIIQKNSLI